MQNKKLPWLSIVSILSMVALLCFQGYWLYNGYRETHDKFIETAKAALQEACNQEKEILKEAVAQKLLEMHGVWLYYSFFSKLKDNAAADKTAVVYS